MTARRLVGLAVAACVLVAAPGVAADPAPELAPSHAVLKSGSATLTMRTTGRSIELPHGSHVLDAPTWERLDAEVRRLQNAEVRLAAENKSLRSSASSWQPGWKTLLGVLVVGVAGGAYARHRLD